MAYDADELRRQRDNANVAKKLIGDNQDVLLDTATLDPPQAGATVTANSSANPWSSMAGNMHLRVVTTSYEMMWCWVLVARSVPPICGRS